MRTLTAALVLAMAPALFAACSEALPHQEPATPPPPVAAAPLTAAPAAPPATPAPPAPPPPPAASAPPAPETAAAPAAPTPAAVRQGEAVFYDSHGRGSCSLTFQGNDDVISAPRSVYNQIQGCGQCLEITGASGTAVARVVDQCFDCPQDRLVLNKPTFDKVVGPNAVKTPVSWKVVPCAVTGNLAFLIKKTSSQYWTAIQVRNHRVALKSAAIKRSDSSDWQEMTRSNDNYFVAAKGVGTGSFALRVTAVDGQTIEQTFREWKDGTTVEGKDQFR